MATPLPYLLITVKVIELEKVSFSDMQILRLFIETLTVNDKYSLLNKDNLTQPIQMPLSQKQKNVSKIFLYIFKI